MNSVWGYLMDSPYHPPHSFCIYVHMADMYMLHVCVSIEARVHMADMYTLLVCVFIKARAAGSCTSDGPDTGPFRPSATPPKPDSMVLCIIFSFRTSTWTHS